VAACGKTQRDDSVHLPRLGNGLDTACDEKGEREEVHRQGMGRVSREGEEQSMAPWTRQVAREEEFFQEDVHDIVPDMCIRGVYEANIRIIYAK
jgi:hypothetical protein